jgi:hypothetical protein
MATYNSDMIAQNNVRVGPHVGISTMSFFATVSCTAAISTSDTANFFVVPKGFRVMYALLYATDMDTGGPTLTINIGDSGDADRIFAASAVGGTGTLSTAMAVTAAGYLYTADTTITGIANANATTPAAGTITLCLIGRFEGTAS